MSKVKVDFSQGFGQIKKFSQIGARTAARELKKEVVDSISRGVSPVKRAGGRFEKYSDSYRTAIDKGRYRQFNKRKRPVNLKLSGELLRSVFSRPVSRNVVEIGFDNPLADIHNRQGVKRKNKSNVVRRMLPTEDGETFSDSILFAVGTALKRVLKRILK